MFSVEIIDCENGYIVLDGNSISIGQPYAYTRKKWVCETPEELGKLVMELAIKAQNKVTA